jgi:hypothetical protein
VPDRPEFGGGAASTVLHPAVFVAFLIIFLLTLIVPRRWVFIPILTGIFFIPLGQQIYAIGVHWFICRLIILGALARVISLRIISKQGVFAGGFNRIDRAFFCYVICQAIAVVLLYREVPALVNQCGFLVDFLGGYTIMRALIRDRNDIRNALSCLAIIVVITGAFTIREQMTGHNFFGVLGGVPLISEVRDGKIRAQAAFSHPLTAGAFGSTALALFFFLWVRGRAKLFAALGILGSTAITICTSSSTPLLAYASSIFVVCLWPIRKKMKTVRWAIVIGLISLQIVMKAPVWFLIARVDLTGSSSGYHRAELVDQFIRHFSDWWLIGTKDAANWGEDLWDTQNEFVGAGESGGLLAFTFFVAMVTYAFARIGDARKRSETSNQEWGIWLLGAALFSNVVAFFGVNYFDQSKMSFFALLAIISVATNPVLNSTGSRKTVEARDRSKSKYRKWGELDLKTVPLQPLGLH